MPVTPDNYHPLTKPVATLLAEVEAAPPPEPYVTSTEWDTLWTTSEQELKDHEQNDNLSKSPYVSYSTEPRQRH